MTDFDFHWTLNGHVGFSSGYGEWLEFSKLSVLFNKAAELHDTGEYMCTAVNAAGSVNTTTIITVVGEPILSNPYYYSYISVIFIKLMLIY